MKMALFVLCLACATLICSTTAFAQYGGSISSQPQIYEVPSHPQHASYTAMSQEQGVLGGAGYSSARGDRRASDFAQPDEVSLGAAARELKKQRTQTKRSRVVWVNQ
jgi:hypothetical protein